MTPREKAIELYYKFTCVAPLHSDNKECALIAVDELIYETQFEVPNVRQKYWLSVKQEIEKI
jgi:hypothetical protein